MISVLEIYLRGDVLSEISPTPLSKVELFRDELSAFFWVPNNNYLYSSDLVQICERANNAGVTLTTRMKDDQPRLRQYDSWCRQTASLHLQRRVDELLVTEAWSKQKETAAREGVVAIAYERKFGQYSRIYQMAKLILWTSRSGLSVIREVCGALLKDQPLHLATVANMELQYRATSQFTFYCIAMLGRIETLHDNLPEVKDRYIPLLCLLTPILKATDCFVGQGYMEETGLGHAMRDVLVNTIWEGTTNVLSLDVLRVMAETGGDALELYCEASGAIAGPTTVV
ncbi:hypothetical protein BGZ67_009739 [Mortierella alpina]|nr:hypothetical protein BGZ67_009739 [Mortierella alpina]